MEIKNNEVLNENVIVYMESYMNETFSNIFKKSIVDDKKDIKILFSMLKQKIAVFGSNAVKKLDNVNDEITDIIVRIDDVISRNKGVIRRDGKNIGVDAEVSNLYLRDKSKSSKIYQFGYDQVYIDPGVIYSYIDRAIEYKEDDDDIDKTTYDYIYKEIENYYKNHSYIDTTEPFVKIKKYKNIQLASAVDYYKSSMKNLYQMMSNINTVVSTETIYLVALQKGYDGMVLKYKDNKKVLKYIDKAFKYALAFTYRSMEWNMDNYDAMYKMFKNMATRMESYYKILNIN